MLMLVEDEPIIEGEELAYPTPDERNKIREAYRDDTLQIRLAVAAEAENEELILRVQDLQDQGEIRAEIEQEVATALETAHHLGDVSLAPVVTESEKRG